MNWLLKIVEGPMKGAEIALVNGMRVKFGSSSECDIVVADSTVGEVAFELDVAESGVTLVGTDGETRPLKAFEIVDRGTTAFAIGPAEGEWEPLTRPAPAEEAAGNDAGEEAKAAEETAPASEETASASEAPAPEEVPAEPSPAEKPARKRRSGCGCLVVLLVLVLLALVVWGLWRHCPQSRPVLEKARPAAAWVRAQGERGWAWCTSKFRRREVVVETPEEIAERRHLALDEIASEYGLELDESSALPRLAGNLRRRTERLAIRALALAADDRVVFDLTDDETLLNQANELLFACSDGALKAVAATNRRVVVTGYAPTAVALERAVRALGEDVPSIVSLDTASVAVGGLPPAVVAGTAFVRDNKGEKPVAGVALKPRRDYPIAGILIEPYPCIVMADGLRLIEGAQIGSAVLETIEADRLTLREGEQTFEWRP